MTVSGDPPRLSALLGLGAALSVLQAVVLVLAGSRQRALGVALALATLLLVGIARRTKGPVTRGLVRVALVAQLVLLVHHLATSPLPYHLRLLQLALVCTWAAVLIATVLVRTGLLRPDRAALLAAGVAAGVLLAEAVVDLVDTLERRRRLQGTGTTVIADISGHREMGYYHVRGGGGRSYYPDNPRGYFHEADAGSRLWTLKRTRGARGRLVFGDGPSLVRVEALEGRIDWDNPDVKRPEAWTVRLLMAEFADGLDAGSYLLRLDARADRPRQVAVSLNRVDEPHEEIGFYRSFDLRSTWQTFERRVDLDRRVDKARLELRLGGDRWPVELRDVELLRLPSRDLPAYEPVAPRLYDPFYVAYAFDSLGCRGPDREIPRPADVRRVLLLGDSYAFGIGVHGEDTLASHLEQRLNDSASGARFEVVNCGVSGFATRQERLHYELMSHRYEADVVVLTMHPNDVRSYLEDREEGYVQRRPARIEFLFHSWQRVQATRYAPPPPDYSASLRELLLLDEQVRANGASLLVAFFRIAEDPAWDEIIAAISSGLAGTSIPVLDLGLALLAGRDPTDLWVHRLDAHPNEIAHAMAAEEIGKLLEQRELVSP